MAERTRGRLNEFFGDVADTLKNDFAETLKKDYSTERPTLNVLGFIGACEGAETGEIVANTAFLFAKRGIHVCVVDFNVFYPNMHCWLGVEPNKRGEGLLRLLGDKKEEIKNVVKETSERKLYLLASSPNDNFEDFYDFSFYQIEKALELVKGMFDVVLINIPNNPPLEFCLASMKVCQKGYFVTTERTEAAANISKLLHHAYSIGISSAKFLDIIFHKVTDVAFDYDSFEKDKTGFNIVAKFPLIKDVWEYYLDDKLYLRDHPLRNKAYVSQAEALVEMLFEKTSTELAKEQKAVDNEFQTEQLPPKKRGLFSKNPK